MKVNLEVLPWEDILDLADVLLEKGVKEDEVVDQIAEILDQMIDFSKIFPNAVGVALETIDKSIFAAAIKVAVAFSLKTPDQRKDRRLRLSKKLERVRILKDLKKNK
jgi:hypothetical protein